MRAQGLDRPGSSSVHAHTACFNQTWLLSVFGRRPRLTRTLPTPPRPNFSRPTPSTPICASRSAVCVCVCLCAQGLMYADLRQQVCCVCLRVCVCAQGLMYLWEIWPGFVQWVLDALIRYVGEHVILTTSLPGVRTRAYIRLYYIYIYIYIRMYVCMYNICKYEKLHTYIYTHTHTYTHTYMPAYSRP